MTKSVEKNLKHMKEMPVKPRINNQVIDLIEKQRKKQKNSSTKEGRSKNKKYRNKVNRGTKKSPREMVKQDLYRY